MREYVMNGGKKFWENINIRKCNEICIYKRKSKVTTFINPKLVSQCIYVFRFVSVSIHLVAALN